LDSLAEHYVRSMDAIFDLYSDMVRRLTEYLRKKHENIRQKEGDVIWKNITRAQACDAIRPTLPAATTSTVGIFGSSQGIENLILHLFSEEMPEFKKSGEDILREARKIAPSFLKRADLADRGMVTAQYMKDNRHAMRDIALQMLTQTPVSLENKVTLVDYWPKNEFDLIPEILFAECHLPLEKIREEVALWSEEKKREVFDAYVGLRQNRRHKPGRALEKVHYEWQITDDYGTFRDLQRHRVVDKWEWQRLTPYYGYDIPELVEEAKMTTSFKKCFSLSEELYNSLIKKNLVEEAQYATLLGHKMRYSFLLNARASFHFHELRSQPAGHPGYRAIVGEMQKKLSEVHPNIGKAICFFNQTDVHLSRLDAEKATREKLNKL
jgi:thymidylate synthase ThyX